MTEIKEVFEPFKEEIKHLNELNWRDQVGHGSPLDYTKVKKETEDLKLSRKSRESKFVTQMVEILNKRKRQKLRQIIFFQKWTRVIKSEKVTEMVK